MPPPPPALLDEMVEEVLLRLLPDDPKSLLRDALVCTRWRRIVSTPGFRRRFIQLHRTPPMLGFLYNRSDASIFVPTCSFRPPSAAHRYGPVVDARHGRVLLLPGFPDWEKRPLENAFVVWDPITDQRRKLPLLPRSVRPADWNADVLCAATPGGACDHLACCGGPFLVIFVAAFTTWMFVYAYSSEIGAWSEHTIITQGTLLASGLNFCMQSALAGNALRFLTKSWNAIIRYDFGTRELSVIHMPPPHRFWRTVLMTTERGELGFAAIMGSMLFLWSREPSSNENGRWVESRVIKLKTLFPEDVFDSSLFLTGSVEGVDIIFVVASRQIFTIDLKSLRVTKVSNDMLWSNIYPYMSFYVPDHETVPEVTEEIQEPKAPADQEFPETVQDETEEPEIHGWNFSWEPCNPWE